MQKRNLYMNTVLLATALLAGAGVRCFGGVSVDSLQKAYSGFDGIVMVSTMVNGDGRTVYTVRSDGAYSYVQYSKSLYTRYYEGHRDIEGEWDTLPAHFNYYDGKLDLISSSPFDPTGMYEHLQLKKPLMPGKQIQQMGCLWPLLPALLERGTLETHDDGSSVLLLRELSLTVSFDASGRVDEVEWKPKDSSAVGRWAYWGYADDPSELLPTRMAYTVGVEPSDPATARPEPQHATLSFDRDESRIDDQIDFTKHRGDRDRQELSTKDVFDSSGTFMYNQDEMAEEYLAALGKEPKRSRWVPISIGTVVAAGLIWGWRRKAGG